MKNQKNHLPTYFMLLFLFLQGCSSWDPCSYEEIKRIKSPDGKVEAVLVRGNCGATTSFSENIFIVPLGGKIPEPKSGYQSLVADHAEGLNIKWREPKVLEIQYNEARIFEFSNFWHSKDVDNFSYVVEIRLIPSKTDFSLSKKDRWIK